MNLLLESMTPLKIGIYSARVWREELMPLLDQAEFDRGDLERVAKAIEIQGFKLTPLSIARNLIQVPRVNAVEVLNPEKRGIVLYKDWP